MTMAMVMVMEMVAIIMNADDDGDNDRYSSSEKTVSIPVTCFLKVLRNTEQFESVYGFRHTIGIDSRDLLTMNST